jgi:3-hydroxyacyl-[acyl-carrier-protein] dehydratase
MSLAEIHAAIPHREPFLLIDEVIFRDERRIVCRKTFRGDEYFYRGHYPQVPLTPGVLLCEAAMQAGAVLLARHVGGRAGLPVATRMNDVRFKRMVRPGETIEIEVELVERLADTFFLKARVTCKEKVAVRFEFACTLAPPPGDGAAEKAVVSTDVADFADFTARPLAATKGWTRTPQNPLQTTDDADSTDDQ